MPTAPSVLVNQVSIAYDSKAIFSELNFELAAGATTCLLGTSGVGKTTLLRCIAGLEQSVVSGSIAASDGKSLDGRIAWMAQQDLLLPWLTVLDNVLLGHRLRGQNDPDATDRARDLLKRVELPDVENKMPDTLSGGMRQRVALARTLMEDRPVTLMDEPFSAVDAITRHRLQELSTELLEGRTTLLVTHDALEAVRVGHAIYVMRGRPASVGEPIVPPGLPTRPLDQPEIMQCHSRLMRLLEADEFRP